MKKKKFSRANFKRTSARIIKKVRKTSIKLADRIKIKRVKGTKHWQAAYAHITYDETARVIYVNLKGRAIKNGEAVKTKEVSHRIMVDYDKKGNPIGVEMIL